MIKKLNFVLLLLLVAVMLLILARRSDLFPRPNNNSVAAQQTGSQALLNFDDKSIKDLSNSYQFVPNIISPHTPQDQPNSTMVTLCTHASDNRMQYIMDLAQFWEGPISVSVFTTRGRLPSVVQAIVRMRHCNSFVKEFVRFHIAMAVSYAPIPDTELADLECNTLNETFSGNNGQQFSEEYIYPSNLLRKISVMHAKTAYVTSLDIDMVPSHNLHTMLQVFLKEHDVDLPPDSAKVAYVLPAFSYGQETFSPFTKQQVRKLWPRNIKQFHTDFCSKCQAKTQYKKWMALNAGEEISVAYTVNWERYWEPFYVSRLDGLPKFDPQFKNYGLNRLSQICEMFVAGYTFKVLNNGFVVHRGINKTIKKDLDAKNEQYQRNLALFKLMFIPEVKLRYPHSYIECIEQ